MNIVIVFLPLLIRVVATLGCGDVRGGMGG
jgi:hypothetical protein